MISKSQPPKIGRIKSSLIGHVVNREDGSRVIEKRIKSAASPKFNRRKAARPIVAVNNVGLPVEVSQQRERGSHKESEAFVVIPETINRGTRKIFRRLDQESRRPRSFALKDSRQARVTAPFDRD